MKKLTTINLLRINRLALYLCGFLFVAVLSLQGWFVVSSYGEYVEKAEKGKLSYMNGITQTLAAAIDGDEYHVLQKLAPLKNDIRESEQEVFYQKIHELLKKVTNEYKLEIGYDEEKSPLLKDEIYTVNFERLDNGGYFASKGVVAKSPEWRHKFEEPIPLENLPSGYSGPVNFKQGKVLMTLAPIRNSEGDNVGFAGFTVDWEPIQAEADAYFSNILWKQIAYAAGLFVMLLAFLIGIRRAAIQEQTRTSVATTRLSNTYKIIEEFVENVKRGDYKSQLRLEAYKDDNLARALDVLHRKLADNARNAEDRSWIAEGRLKIASILRMHNDFEALALEVVMEVADYMKAAQGALYICNGTGEEMVIEMKALYAYNRRKYQTRDFKFGEGLVGQCAYEQATIYRTEIPDDYITISSGLLGTKKPKSLLLVPLITDEKLFGIIELASTDKFSDIEIRFVEELGDIIARTIFNLQTNIRTLELLKESQEKSQELERNERKVYSLLENSSEVISIYDENGNLTYQSPSVTNILGYTPEEVIGKSDIDKVNPKGQDKVRNMFRSLVKNPDEQPKIEYSYQRKDGSWVWLEAIGKNFVDDPAVNGIVLNSRDITERRLRESEQIMRGKMQALSENSRDIILRFDLEGKFLYSNPMLATYTGLDVTEYADKPFHDAPLEPSVKEGWTSILEEIQEKDALISREMTFPTKEGERIMQVTAIPEYDSDDVLETVLMVSHDITERKKQEEVIRMANQKITDSINYARHIQDSIIPDNSIIMEHFPDSFIFYKAKDVVSGDFPWFRKKGDDIYFAAVDCTGHGVPGAMMSLIGYFLLHNITDHKDNPDPATVLTELDEGVRRTLHQDREGAQARDGMDVALCKINLKKNEVEFAGAHRPLYLVRGDELTQFKGARRAIGGTHAKKPRPFETSKLKMQKGDAIYFFSDGLPDQFGGPDDTKYSPRRIRDIVSEHHGKEMQELRGIFSADFESWMANTKQLDDVLLIGIKF